MFLLVATSAWATFPPVNFTEVDGSPSVYPYKVKVTNGSLTDNGDNTVTITGAVSSDTVYGGGWNGSLLVPSQNAVYDKIEALSTSGGGTTDTGLIVHLTTATDDFAVGGVDSNAPIFIDESNKTIEAEGGFISGDGTDNDVTIMTVDLLSGNQAIAWDDTNGEFDFSAPLNVSSTSPSTLNLGTTINDSSDATSDGDTNIKSANYTAFKVDAALDKIFATVPLDMTTVPIRSAGLSTTGITVGINQWDDANDKVDGNEIGDDTIDEDALDSGFIHLQVHSAKLAGACAVNGDAANAEGPGIDAGESAWMLDFDDDADEGACWQFVMPETYNGGAVDVRLLYKHVATSCEVTWEVAWCADSDGETPETVGCSAYNTQLVTTPGTAGLLDTAVIEFTNSADAGSVVKGDLVQLQVSTDADGGGGVDDCVGDSELVGVLVEW